MKPSAKFAGNVRLVVKWTGTSMPKLEKSLEELLRGYGLSLTGLGYDYVDYEREMIFHATDRNISPGLYKIGHSAAERQ